MSACTWCGEPATWHHDNLGPAYCSECGRCEQCGAEIRKPQDNGEWLCDECAADDTCSACQGTGIGQHGDPDTSRCSLCHGTGVYRRDCSRDDFEPPEDVPGGYDGTGRY